jgi:polar amino acid transport system ATP-binding protein
MFNLEKVTKEYSFDTEKIYGLDNVSFSVDEGEIICVLGQSGSGKSTLLRVLADLEKTQEGQVNFNREKVSYGYVSQSYTLWPHLTVLENLTLAPSLEGKQKVDDITKEAKKLLARFGLEKYANSYPSQLSGGQKQRAALLRAIIKKPKVLLLDEITSALDPELTKGVLDLVRALSKDGYTMLIVTHHMSFALSVADRILFLKDGKLVADQTSADFFMNQKNEEIRSFILDIAKKDENIEVFRGLEQFQAYHLGLMRRLPENSTIYVAGGVSDEWYSPMGAFYNEYEKIRISKNITWKMVTYLYGETEKRLVLEHPELNKFAKMPKEVKNPANYIIFGDTVATQIFGDNPSIIQIKNSAVATAYLQFFDELWSSAKHSHRNIELRRLERGDLFEQDKIAEEYDLLKMAIPHHDEFQEQVAVELKSFLGSKEEPRILELGSGTGITTQEIVKASPNARIVALDLEAGMQEQAKAKNISQSIEYVTADAYEYLQSLEDGSFDALVTTYTLHNFDESFREQIVSEIYRVIKPGGLFLNADKYALADEEEYRKVYDEQVKMYDVFDTVGKSDLKKEWVEHYAVDDKPGVRLVDEEFKALLEKEGFEDVKLTWRILLEAVITAKKPE